MYPLKTVLKALLGYFIFLLCNRFWLANNPVVFVGLDMNLSFQENRVISAKNGRFSEILLRGETHAISMPYLEVVSHALWQDFYSLF